MHIEQKKKNQSLLSGAFFLMITTAIVHIIGVLYKIPLTTLIGPVGRGYFTSAYEIYTPIYAISMAGLPVAVSKMVSESVSQGKYAQVKKIHNVVWKIFLVTGIIGTAILLALAYPYTHLEFFINTPNAMPSIIAIAPSIFFCCMMSAYRGYYEGLRNMMPTGISQVIETLGKFVFGMILAKIVLNKGLEQYASTGTVFGTVCKTQAEASSAIAPYSAAAAIGGVTLGTIAALIFLIIRHKAVGDGITEEEVRLSPKADSGKAIAKTLISIAIPVVLSSLVLNITNLIDTWTIQNRLLASISDNLDFYKTMYADSLQASHILDSDIKDYLYGSYGVALDFKNIVPTITMTLGVSAIPVLSGAWVMGDKEKVKSSVNSVMRVAMLIAFPCGLGMAVMAKPILTMFYNGTSTESSIAISAPVVAIYGIAAFLLAASTPITNMLQAIGRADVPVKSLLFGATAKIICNYFLVYEPHINIYGAPIGTILCYIIIVSLNLHALKKETGSIPPFVSCFLKPLLCGATCAASAYGFYRLFLWILPAGNTQGRLSGATFATLIAILLAAVVYIISLLLFRAIDKNDIKMLPKGEKIVKVLEKRGLIG